MSTLEATTSNIELGRRVLMRLLQDMSDTTLTTSNNNNNHDTNSTGIGPAGEMPPPATGGSRQAYEFFAFLLWYLLLVLCCLIPTCCAYRRRRRLEARLSQQQENFDQMQQQNMIFLNNLTQRQNTNEALFHEQRCQLVSKAIEDTTMMVQEKDIEQRRGGGGGDGIRPRPAAVAHDVVNTSGRSLVVGAAAIVLDEETTALLRLPNDAPNGNRTVPAACAICLNAYEIRDRVTWSPMPTCQHAFHQECIVPWLTNKSECPCCRQEFCPLPMSVRASSSGNRLTWSRFQPMAGAVVVVNAANELPTTVTAAVGVSLTDEHDLSLVQERMEEGFSPPLHTIDTEIASTDSVTSPSSPGQSQLQTFPASPSSTASECVDSVTNDLESRPCHDDVGANTELTPTMDLPVAAVANTTVSSPPALCVSSPDTDTIPLPRIRPPNDGAVEESSLPSSSQPYSS